MKKNVSWKQSRKARHQYIYGGNVLTDGVWERIEETPGYWKRKFVEEEEIEDDDYS